MGLERSKLQGGGKVARVTLRAVAKKAGVSYQTVSNVINNLDLVRPETRAKVQQAIAELGYVPHFAARALRQARSMTLAAVFHQMTDAEVTDPYRTLVQTALAHAARQHHHSLLTYHVGEDLSDLLQHFAQGRLDGAVLVGPELSPQARQELQQAGRPLVAFDHRFAGAGQSSVTAQYREGIHQVLEHLVQRGKTRIAFLSGVPITSGAAEERLEAFLEGMERLGLPVHPGHLVQGHWTFEGGQQAFDALWDAAERPDAMVAANDRMAAGALNRALHRGVQVPAELALTGVDDFEFARYLVPALTTVQVPYPQMAAEAVQVLLDLLEGEEHVGTRRLPVVLQVRESS